MLCFYLCAFIPLLPENTLLEVDSKAVHLPKAFDAGCQTPPQMYLLAVPPGGGCGSFSHPLSAVITIKVFSNQIYGKCILVHPRGHRGLDKETMAAASSSVREKAALQPSP